MQPEAEVLDKPKNQKKPPADALPVYDVPVNVGKISQNIVPKHAVTAAEIALLIAHFGMGLDGVDLDKAEEAVPPMQRMTAGADPVTKAERFKRVAVYYTAKNEIPRLRHRYGNALVKHVFGAGMSATIPKTLDDVREMQIEAFQKPDEKDAA